MEDHVNFTIESNQLFNIKNTEEARPFSTQQNQNREDDECVQENQQDSLHLIPDSITPINKKRSNTDINKNISDKESNALAKMVHSIFGQENEPQSPVLTIEEIQDAIKLQMSEELENNKTQLMYIFKEFTKEQGPLVLSNLDVFVDIVCDLLQSVTGTNSKENLKHSITENIKQLFNQKLRQQTTNSKKNVLQDTSSATFNKQSKSLSKNDTGLRDHSQTYKLNEEYKDQDEGLQLEGFTQSMHAGTTAAAANLTISLLQKNSTLNEIQEYDNGYQNNANKSKLEDSKSFITFDDFFEALFEAIMSEIENFSMDELKELKKDRVKDSIIMSSFMFSPKKGNNNGGGGTLMGSGGLAGSRNKTGGGYFGSTMKQTLMPIDVSKLDSKTRTKFEKVQEILIRHETDIEAIIKKDTLTQKNSIIKALEFLPFNICVNADAENSKADFNPLARNQQSNDLVERFIDELMIEVESKFSMTEFISCKKLLCLIFELFLNYGHNKYLFKKKNIEEEKIRAELHGLDDFLLEDQQDSDSLDRAPETLDEQLQATVVQYQKMIEKNEFKNEQEKHKIQILLKALKKTLGNKEQSSGSDIGTRNDQQQQQQQQPSLKDQPHPLRHLASFDSNKFKQKTTTAKKKSRNQSQTSQSDHAPKSFDDKRLKNLRSIFDFYSKQQLMIGKNATFEQIQKVVEHMNMGEFIRYCLDFKIPLNKTQIMSIFKKASENTKELSFQQFIEIQGMLFLQVNIDNARLLRKEIHSIAAQAANSVIKGGINAVSEQQQQAQNSMVELLSQIKSKTKAEVQEEALLYIEIDDIVKIELKKKGISLPFHTREGSSQNQRQVHNNSGLAFNSTLQLSYIGAENTIESQLPHEFSKVNSAKKLKILSQEEKDELKQQVKQIKDKRQKEKEDEISRKKNRYSVMRKKLLTQLEVPSLESQGGGVKPLATVDTKNPKPSSSMLFINKKGTPKNASFISGIKKNQLSIQKTDSESSQANINTLTSGVFTLQNLTNLNYKDLNTQSDDDFDPTAYGFDKDPQPQRILEEPEAEIHLQIQNDTQEYDQYEYSKSPPHHQRYINTIPKYKSPYSKSVSPASRDHNNLRSSRQKKKRIVKLAEQFLPLASKFGYQNMTTGGSEYYQMMSNRQLTSTTQQQNKIEEQLQKINLGGRQQPSQSTAKQRQNTYSPMGRYGSNQKSQKVSLPSQLFYSPQDQTQVSKHQKMLSIANKYQSPLKEAQSSLGHQQSVIVQQRTYFSGQKPPPLPLQLQMHTKQFSIQSNSSMNKNNPNMNLPHIFNPTTKSLSSTPNNASSFGARIKMPPRPQQNLQLKNQLSSPQQNDGLLTNRLVSMSKTPLKSRLTFL